MLFNVQLPDSLTCSIKIPRDHFIFCLSKLLSGAFTVYAVTSVFIVSYENACVNYYIFVIIGPRLLPVPAGAPAVAARVFSMSGIGDFRWE